MGFILDVRYKPQIRVCIGWEGEGMFPSLPFLQDGHIAKARHLSNEKVDRGTLLPCMGEIEKEEKQQQQIRWKTAHSIGSADGSVSHVIQGEA